MGKFDGILLCSDYDGTLGIGGKISEENRDAIRYFQENGGLFTLVSGRNPHLLDQWLTEIDLKVNAPLVGYNGALIMDEQTGEILYSGGRQDLLALELAEQLWEHAPETYRVVLHDNTTRSLAIFREGEDTPSRVHSFDEMRSKCIFPLYNMLCTAKTPEETEHLLHILQELSPDDFEIARSWSKGVEIICNEDTKGAAAKRLKRMLNAKLLVTVGDFENDISMLEAGDISYAVENALPHVKAVAKRQTVHYEQSAIAAIVAELERDLRTV